MHSRHKILATTALNSIHLCATSWNRVTKIVVTYTQIERTSCGEKTGDASLRQSHSKRGNLKDFGSSTPRGKNCSKQTGGMCLVWEEELAGVAKGLVTQQQLRLVTNDWPPPPNRRSVMFMGVAMSWAYGAPTSDALSAMFRAGELPSFSDS